MRATICLGVGIPPRSVPCSACQEPIEPESTAFIDRHDDLFCSDCARLMQVEEARARGDAGRQQAEDHAERDDPGWTDAAVSAVAAATTQMVGEFTFEQLRQAASARVAEPPDLRAWGSVARRAIAARIIVATGRYAPRASGNCTPTMLYTRA